MKTFITALLLFGSAYLSAQSDSSIVGLMRENNSNELYLASFEPSTGQLNPISTAPVGDLYSLNGLAAIDPYQMVYYYINFNTLIGVSLQSGAVVSSATFSLPEDQYFDALQFNLVDSALYGIVRYSTFSPWLHEVRLSTIDPSTGDITILSETAANALVSVNGMATIDPFNQVYYMINPPHEVIGFDMADGSIASTVNLGLPLNTHLDFLRFNYVDSTFYCIWRHVNPDQMFDVTQYLARIDMVTGELQQISENPIAQGFVIFSGLGTIDPSSGIFYLTGSFGLQPNLFDIIGVDISSGEVVVETSLPGSDTDYYFELMMYYPDVCPPHLLFSLMHTNEDDRESAFTLYPNPANQFFRIAHPSPGEEGSYTVWNLPGQQVASGQLGHDKTYVDITGWEAGMYVVTLEYRNVKQNRRLVVQ